MLKGAQFDSKAAFFSISLDEKNAMLEIQTKAIHGSVPGYTRVSFGKKENPKVCEALERVVSAMVEEGAEAL